MNIENSDFYKYTGPQRFDRAMHTLEGLLEGITLDCHVNDNEITSVVDWMGQHTEFAEKHPFSEVLPRITQIVADGIVDEEERADLLWLCTTLTRDTFYNVVTSDMQRLQGVLGGILADGEITVEELRGLSEWLDVCDHLRCCWPYDEIDSILAVVLQDGRIDEREQFMLRSFFSEFTDFPWHKSLDLPDHKDSYTLSGVCAVDPCIEFPDRRFCFTGESDRATRRSMSQLIESRGGIHSKRIVGDLDYLVIGAKGNPCWAYACYGRKIEEAIALRKSGARMLLVHEFDFWDAI